MTFDDLVYVVYASCVAPLLVIGVRWLIVWTFGILRRWSAS